MLYGLLEEIDRAGYLRGTASWLEWLRLKSAASRTSAKANARALYALLAEIHRLGLIAGTDAHARWLMLKAGVKRGVAAVPTGSFPSCQGQFFFWRGRQMQRAVVGDVRHHFEVEPDGD